MKHHLNINLFEVRRLFYLYIKLSKTVTIGMGLFGCGMGLFGCGMVVDFGVR